MSLMTMRKYGETHHSNGCFKFHKRLMYEAGQHAYRTPLAIGTDDEKKTS